MSAAVPIAVRVPASSANLGPGFDAFAVAVDVHVTVTVTDRGGPLVSTEGEGAGELPEDEGNLVWRAFVAACEVGGVTPPDVSLAVHNTIPLERGLGSSAAAAAAGAVVARALTGRPTTDDGLIAVVADLEGHPDNAAAAVLGGLVVYSGGRAHRFDPSDRLCPLLCLPPERQSTTAARGLLASTVPLSDAAGNAARAALVVAGLTGQIALDPEAMVDVLHEPPRLAAMPSSGELVAALRTDGIAACLSGAGPAVLAIADRHDELALARVTERLPDRWLAQTADWDRSGAVLLDPPA